jgi:hypothetical protein
MYSLLAITPAKRHVQQKHRKERLLVIQLDTDPSWKRVIFSDILKGSTMTPAMQHQYLIHANVQRSNAQNLCPVSNLRMLVPRNGMRPT